MRSAGVSDGAFDWDHSTVVFGYCHTLGETVRMSYGVETRQPLPDTAIPGLRLRRLGIASAHIVMRRLRRDLQYQAPL